VHQRTTQMDDAAIRAELERHWSVTGAEDPALVHAIYDENVVVEYPQSHETIHGRANLQALREAYPATLTITLKRIRGHGRLWVSEYVIAYDGKPVNIISIMEFAQDKVVRETLYFADPFEAPTWRSQWVSLDSTTQLPKIDDAYPLSTYQIEQFRLYGHVLLRGVASPAEISAYRPAIVDAVRRYTTESRPLEERDTYGKAFLQVMNLWERDDAVRAFVLSQRFARIAAELMGADGVRLFHDQALFKEPGGGITPWHQDQIYWPMETDQTVTMWMPLVDIPAEAGSMTFVSGSHRSDYHSMMTISDESEDHLQRYVESQQLPLASSGAMAAGDATFHAGWTIHRAPGNPTSTMREVMTIIYFADGARLLAHPHPLQENDFAWFPGRQPGDLAEGPRNPLVYRR
jgi:ectoine hydroxylase-related dioxygenase (phytanoyl-CoA dioxygenase family)